MSDSRLERARDAIERLDPELRALIHRADFETLARTDGPLAGLPYTLKDVWDVAGLPTTRGAGAPLAPARESGAVHRVFEQAGAVFVGKTNLSDRGLTPECASWAGGVTRHPQDPSRTSGGSSGGAAVAVATGMADFDWGTDFGGSIRLPAAFCGVYGMRLSARRWPIPRATPDPRPPLIRRLNGMGPLTRDLPTMRRVLSAAEPLRTGDAPEQRPFVGALVLGPDDFCRGRWPGFEAELTRHLSRRGVPSWRAPLPSASIFDRAFVALIAGHSAEVLPPALRPGLGAITSALTFGPALGDRRLHPSSAAVLAKLWVLRQTRDRRVSEARAEAARLCRAVDALFALSFVLVTPSSTLPAPRHGRALSTRGLATFAKLGNLVDATALSMPFGTLGTNLPRGLQLLGPPGSEMMLLDLASRIAPDGHRGTP